MRYGDTREHPLGVYLEIEEPAKKHSDELAKTIRAHGTDPPILQPMARQLYLFFGCNLIKERAKTIQAHGTPKHSNRQPDN
jgi:hypothetical protein